MFQNPSTVPRARANLATVSSVDRISKRVKNLDPAHHNAATYKRAYGAGNPPASDHDMHEGYLMFEVIDNKGKGVQKPSAEILLNNLYVTGTLSPEEQVNAIQEQIRVIGAVEVNTSYSADSPATTDVSPAQFAGTRTLVNTSQDAIKPGDLICAAVPKLVRDRTQAPADGSIKQFSKGKRVLETRPLRADDTTMNDSGLKSCLGDHDFKKAINGLGIQPLFHHEFDLARVAAAYAVYKDQANAVVRGEGLVRLKAEMKNQFTRVTAKYDWNQVYDQTHTGHMAFGDVLAGAYQEWLMESGDTLVFPDLPEVRAVGGVGHQAAVAATTVATMVLEVNGAAGAGGITDIQLEARYRDSKKRMKHHTRQKLTTIVPFVMKQKQVPVIGIAQSGAQPGGYFDCFLTGAVTGLVSNNIDRT